jgi:hypothetical protein
LFVFVMGESPHWQLGRLLRVTILDDAREGMDTNIRPQDDLFGHVNGTWLKTCEIPSDRSSWGPFVTLADEAEKQVKEIIEACASGEITGDDAVKIGDLFASFMDEDRVNALGADPVRPRLAQIEALTSKGELGAFLGAFERDGGGGIFGSYIDTDDRNSDRYLVNVLQAASACRMSPTTAMTNSPRFATSTSPTSRRCSTSPGSPSPLHKPNESSTWRPDSQQVTGNGPRPAM